jgi:pantoate--beta-alanine ligase
MITVRSVAEVRAHVAEARRGGRSVALVPTMGALHAGHDALVRRAHALCDEVVVSLFVNPAQFNDQADLVAYPRTEEADVARLEALGVHALFAPPPDEPYPPGHATRVVVGGLSEVLEGEFRGAAHFAGVCTIVAWLLNAVGPDIAVFGQKDAQQAAVVARMVRDLALPGRLEIVPTVRENDGLALSSRNVRLSPEERVRALALPRALEAAAAAVAAGERDGTRITAAAHAAMAPFDVAPEYLAVVDPETVAPVERLNGRALVAIAAHVGPVRLIDNAFLSP